MEMALKNQGVFFWFSIWKFFYLLFFGGQRKVGRNPALRRGCS
jgi:hypothetical protein